MGGYKAFDMLLKLSSRYHTFGIEFCSKIRFINVVLIGIKFKLKSPRDQIMNGIYPRCRYADGLYCETLGTFSQWKNNSNNKLRSLGFIVTLENISLVLWMDNSGISMTNNVPLVAVTKNSNSVSFRVTAEQLNFLTIEVHLSWHV